MWRRKIKSILWRRKTNSIAGLLFFFFSISFFLAVSLASAGDYGQPVGIGRGEIKSFPSAGASGQINYPIDICTLQVFDCPGETTAYITYYNDSKNLMASGKRVYAGAVAVSDRTIPLGTKIKIGDKIYTVEDRTALWVHKRQGLTIDIWSPLSDKELLAKGRTKAIIELL